MAKSLFISDKEKELKKRMNRARIFEKDIKEEFILSPGPGGQNVNKTATCVQLVHIPTGIRIKCHEGRTQKGNRIRARMLLADQVEKVEREAQENEQYLREKNRRKKRRRPLVLKEKILKEKHQRSEKKASRKRISLRDTDALD